MPSTLNEFLEKAFKDYSSEVNKKGLNEGYTEKELSRINVKADTVNVKISDYDGNSTKNLGMNDKTSLMALKKFIEMRMKNI